MKKRLDNAKGRWAEELPNVLWAYQTTPRRSTGKNLFSLTYGAEVIIPAEINLCSARVGEYALAQNIRMMVKSIDSLEEHREAATIRLVEYQQKLSQWYDRDVRTRGFKAGDMVLRKAVWSMRDMNAGKLALVLGRIL